MEENNDKKTTLSGKLQLKKTFNAGQIKQNFSHGRSKSVSVEVKRKRTFDSFEKKSEVEDKIKSESINEEIKDEIKPVLEERPKPSREPIKDLNPKKNQKKSVSKINTEPSNFSEFSSLIQSFKPIWGTCP